MRPPEPSFPRISCYRGRFENTVVQCVARSTMMVSAGQDTHLSARIGPVGTRRKLIIPCPPRGVKHFLTGRDCRPPGPEAPDRRALNIGYAWARLPEVMPVTAARGWPLLAAAGPRRPGVLTAAGESRWLAAWVAHGWPPAQDAERLTTKRGPGSGCPRARYRGPGPGVGNPPSPKCPLRSPDWQGSASAIG